VKSKKALHLAEHVWHDLAHQGSLFDKLMQTAPILEELQKAGKTKEMTEKLTETQNEMVARIANVLMEADEHDED